MKKLYRIAVLVLIFCLCFTTAVFGADAGQNAVPANQENLFRCGHLPFAPGHEFQLVTLDDVAWRSGEYSGTPTVEKIPSKYPHFDTPAETPLLVLVLEFNNISYKDDYDWGNSIFQGQYSLAQYYKDMSFNQFSFVPAKETSAYNVGGNHNTKDRVNDGVVHITVNANHGCWDLESKTEDMKWINCLVEGIKKADAYVDFSSFDKNNDGEITTDEMALAVVVAGYEAAFDSGFSQGKNYYLWSHAWNIYSGWYYYYQNQYDWEDFLPCPDGVYVDSYIAIAEQLQKNRQEPISVLAHELGHYLGLPDLYDTDYGSDTWSTYDVSDLSVMCSGSWGWNNILNDYMPVAFDAWSRCSLGWVVPETVRYGKHYVISDKGDGYNVLRVETGIEGDYYLLENREISGWDQGLNSYQNYASNGGLVCWHIDDAIYNKYSESNSVNNSGHRPGVMPLYPEKKNNKITFIGTLSSDGLNRPFFTYDIWNSYYASTLDCVDFPTYNGSDTPGARTFSGVQMNILQAPNSHTIRVTFGDPPAHTHNLVAVPAKDPTCTGTGNTAYWTCTVYGECFSDAAGTTEIDGNSWVIPAIGHNWNTENVVFNWTEDYSSAEAVFTCKNDSSHTKTVAATVTSEAGDGVIIYTATAVFEGGTYTDQKTVAGYLGPDHLRIHGSNRYETALMTADHMRQRKLIEKFDTVIVADGRNFADALSGSYLSNVCEAPILLVYPGFEQTLFDYIKQNTVDGAKVYLLGGPGAVSENFEGLLTRYDVERLGGANRFETNLLILKAANSMEGAPKNEVLVCSGTNFADALSTSSVGKPILLVGNSLSDQQKQYLTDANTDTAWIIGGTGAVSESVESELSAFVPAANTNRLGGANRFETSYKVADEFFAGSVETAVLVYGMNFPDGLSGGAVASVLGSPILLAMNNDSMNAFVAPWVTEAGAVKSITLGGPTLISDASIRSIMNQPGAEIVLFE